MKRRWHPARPITKNTDDPEQLFLERMMPVFAGRRRTSPGVPSLARTVETPAIGQLSISMAVVLLKSAGQINAAARHLHDQREYRPAMIA